MNIKKHLLSAQSKVVWMEVITFVGKDTDRFADLMVLFFHAKNRLQISACQCVGIITEKEPQLIVPYIEKIIHFLKSNPISAVKRNAMRIFQFIEIPEKIEGELFDIAFNYLKNIDEPIAIKVFSMTTLRRICEKYPELAQEVIFQLEIILKENPSKGVVSRGKLELKKLQKIHNSTI